MMLPSEQKSGEYEEHLRVPRPQILIAEQKVKQGLADVRRSHRLDVHQNACESQGEQFCKTGARSSAEKLSIKNIFNVHIVRASLPATMLRVNPELQETKFGTRAQQPGACSSCSRAKKPALLHSRRPCPNSLRSMSLKTPPSSPRANRSESQKAARPSQSFRSKSLATTMMPDDSASHFAQKGGFQWLTSARKL